MARLLETIIFDLFLLHIRKQGHTEGKGLTLVTQQGRGRDKKGIQFPDLELPHAFLQLNKEGVFTEHQLCAQSCISLHGEQERSRKHWFLAVEMEKPDLRTRRN